MHLVYTATRTPEYFHQVRAFPSSFAIFSRSWDMIPESPGTFLFPTARLDKACEKAIEYGYQWLWTESSCATNIRNHTLWKSIFELYRMANLCFVYLPDIEKVADWGQSKWFQHAYTLPELVASIEILFFTKTGEVVGRKSDLCKELSSITGIEEAVLRNPEEVQSCSVAKRMSWASLRDAKEVGKEDLAYCLIGIFCVPNLSVRYNGLTNAMLSLQLEIMKHYPNDLSIFEWQQTDNNDPCTNGLLAGSPFQFRFCGEVKTPSDNGSKIEVVQNSDNMFCIKGLLVPQPLDRIGLVLNSYHPNPNPNPNPSPDADADATGYTLIPLSKAPPESPESPVVGCYRTAINRVSCINVKGLREEDKLTGHIYIRGHKAAFFEGDDSAAHPIDVLERVLA